MWERPAPGGTTATRALATAILLSGLLSPAVAQSTSATLAGNVRDASGEPVAGAQVQARSEEQGTVRATGTDADGRFRLEALPPGIWTVVARDPDGILTDSYTVVLTLQQTVQVELTVGAGLQEQVTVTASPPLVDPQRTGAELRVTGSDAEALPLAGRAVTDLALLDASVRAPQPGTFSGERGSVFVVAGQSGRANSFLVDGLDNNDAVSGTNLDAWFSPQVVREFVVMTHQFAPEFGRASGGVLNLLTERGTNKRAGDFFVQGSSSSWNSAGDLVASLPSTEGEPDTSSVLGAGFRMGGPIVADKAFYFFSFEHAGADEVVPFTGVDRNGVAGGRVLGPKRDDGLFLRTDVQLTPSDTLMVRLSADDRSGEMVNVGGGLTPETGFHLDESDLQLAASLTSVLSSTAVNELRILAGGSRFAQDANSARPGVERPSGVFGGNSLNRQRREESRFQIVDNLTLGRGPHTFKVGYDVTRSRTRIDAAFHPNGTFLYQTDTPFEPGDAGDLNVSQVEDGHCSAPPFGACRGDFDCTGGAICLFDPIASPGTPGVDDDGDGQVDEPGRIDTYPLVYSLINGAPSALMEDTRIALFAQDAWRVTPRLTLDYGLRYDLSTYRLPESARVDSAIPNGGAPRDTNNLAPRLGFAWEALPSGNLVVRGGAGIFHDKLVLAFPGVAAITSGTEIGLFFPQGQTLEITEDVVEQVGIDVIRQGLVFPPELVLRLSTGTRLDTPYAMQASLGAEGALGRHAAWSATLLRSQGYHVPLMRDLNPPDPTEVTTRGPAHPADRTTGSIAAILTDGRAWYNGLDLALRWRHREDWLSLSYTLSRAEDLGSDPLKGGISLPPNSSSPELEHARSDQDRRHRVVLAGETGLPWALRGSSIVSWMSGAPFNVTTGRDANLDGLTNDRPEGVSRNTGAHTPLAPINSLRAALGLPEVTALHEPSFLQLDLRLWLPFAGRQGRMPGQVYLQVVNVLDRYNGGPVEGRVASRDFGRPVGLAGPPRTVQLGVKLGF